MARPLCRERAAANPNRGGDPSRSPWAAPENPLDAGPGRLDPETGENPGDLPRPRLGPVALQAPGDFFDEIRQPVQRRPGLDEARHAAADLAPPVDHGLDGDDERAGGRLDRESIPGRVPQDRKALPWREMRAPSGFHAQEPGPQEVEVGPELLDLLVQGVDLGSQGPAPRNTLAPAVVGESEPACDHEEGLDHGGSVPAPSSTANGQPDKWERGGHR